MSAALVLLVVGLYFALLIGVSFLAGRSDDHQAFFLGNRQSPWYVVAFGMIGASLSGVTFISVPGWTEASGFSYLQVVLGYVLGYLVIIKVLLPLYYRLELTSIYTYLAGRFGFYSYKTGATFFLLSRLIGAAFRLYLVALVLQFGIFSALRVPFWLTVAITIALIWVYTYRSGIKTIIWTDTLQTAFMLAAVGVAIWSIKGALFPEESLWSYVASSDKSQIFFWQEWRAENHFLKQFISGAFITIAMTGLDQDMMQKNLSCRNLKDAQKNMFWLSLSLVAVNLVFLSLGVLLYDYAEAAQLSFAQADQLFAAVALNGDLGMALAIFFIIGLIAAAYSSADSALTALTTSFSVDILGIEKMAFEKGKKMRKRVHLLFSVLLFGVILIFRELNNESVIKELFIAAGYTYGPLLGLYAFGLFTPWKVRDHWVPVVAILSPLLAYLGKIVALRWFGYAMSFEHLILNGLITFAGLYLLRISSSGRSNQH